MRDITAHKYKTSRIEDCVLYDLESLCHIKRVVGRDLFWKKLREFFRDKYMERLKLGDICEIISGSTPKTNIEQYWDGDVKWITPAEIDDDTYIISDSARKITELGVKKTGLAPLPEGTVILSSRAPIGKVAIAGCELYCNQGFKNLVCTEKINNQYLYWFLKRKRDYLNSLGRGATFKEISKKIVANIEINVPTIEEQLEVVEHLNKCYQIVKLRKQECDDLDDLIKSRFVEMFGDRYINNRGWNTKKLGECIVFHNGKAHEKVIEENGAYILVTSKAIASELQDVRKTNALLYPLHKGDIVMVMSDVPNGRALAKCLLIDCDDKYTLNQRICSFDGYDFEPIFLVNLLSRHQYFLNFNDGNGQTNLRKDDILNCPLIVPPRELQDKFATFVQSVDKLKSAA